MGRAVRHDPRLLADHGPRPRSTGFFVDVGWGTYGFKAGPGGRARRWRSCIADGKTPEIIAAFGLDRFADGRLVGEKGAAAVGPLTEARP